jgi:hypothetical protein
MEWLQGRKVINPAISTQIDNDVYFFGKREIGQCALPESNGNYRRST